MSNKKLLKALHEEMLNDNMVYIKVSRYNELLRNEQILQALEGAGVDNWDGYDCAMEMLNE